jgi:ketosteroid isomerase-like protein
VSSTLETVAGWYGSAGELNQATLETWSEYVWHPDIEWRAIEGAADDVGLIEGRERLYRYYAEWLELFDDLHNDVLETHEVGERIVLRMRVTGRSRSAGVPVELDYALVVELCDGRIIRGREFATVDQALEAAANWG